ncbi:putative xyloglucan-specific endo-beta-1 [Phytophthora citrophthora]|uniref:Xyloglucan-specific endo-beta-1 n=1 Tax=Phytophthora citrophthora TaxID=4793 RepID=A0AAD9LQS0_9STRA|nr:putative xyloglucan-specific endo-beta-1 [Phytophthora citrophthora]
MKFLLPAALAVAVVALTDAQQHSYPVEYFCGPTAFKVVGDYIVSNNGQTNVENGGQCTEVIGNTSTAVSWKTSFNWPGDAWMAKSFANAALKLEPKQLSTITSIPTTIQYEYTHMDNDNVIANVMYDLSTSSSANGYTEYELMVWLETLGGVSPLTSSGKPIKTVTIGSVEFDLYQGMDEKIKVFSYVAKKTAKSFTTDLKQFFNELPAANNIPLTQYLQKVKAGTKVFQGETGKLEVSTYSVQVK